MHRQAERNAERVVRQTGRERETINVRPRKKVWRTNRAEKTSVQTEWETYAGLCLCVPQIETLEAAKKSNKQTGMSFHMNLVQLVS